MANKDVFVTEILHFFCVILSVGSVGSSISRFSPTHFRQPLGVDFQRPDTDFSGHFDEDSSWDTVPAGEDRDIAVVVTVIAYNEALDFS